MIVDYRKRRAKQAPINIDRAVVERVESFKLFGVHITNKLLWSKHTKTVVKRARQHLFPLRILKRFGIGPQILKKLYCCTIESILTGCITAWYGSCSASNRKALQREVRTTQYITGTKLPAATQGLLSMHSHFTPTYTLPQTTLTNLYPRTLTRYRYPMYIALLLLCNLIVLLFICYFSLFTKYFLNYISVTF